MKRSSQKPWLCEGAQSVTEGLLAPGSKRSAPWWAGHCRDGSKALVGGSSWHHGCSRALRLLSKETQSLLPLCVSTCARGCAGVGGALSPLAQAPPVPRPRVFTMKKINLVLEADTFCQVPATQFSEGAPPHSQQASTRQGWMSTWRTVVPRHGLLFAPTEAYI